MVGKKVSAEENGNPENSVPETVSDTESAVVETKSNGSKSAKLEEDKILDSAASIFFTRDAAQQQAFLEKIGIYPFAYREHISGKQVLVTPRVTREIEQVIFDLARIVSNVDRLNDLITHKKAYMTNHASLVLQELSGYFHENGVFVVPAFNSISRMSVIVRAALRESQYYSTPPRYREERPNFRGYKPPPMDSSLDDLYAHEVEYTNQRRQKRKTSAGDGDGEDKNV